MDTRTQRLLSEMKKDAPLQTHLVLKIVETLNALVIVHGFGREDDLLEFRAFQKFELLLEEAHKASP